MDSQLEKAIDDQQALQELRAEAQTPEDHAVLDAEQARLTNQRMEAVQNRRVGQFVVQDGMVVATDEINAARAAGHDTSTSAYNNGRRA